MAAGRRAPDSNLIRVNAELVSVSPHVANRRLAVVNLRRERRDVSQPIADADTDVVTTRDERSEQSGAAGLVAALPSTSMNPYDQRPRRGALSLGLIDVELEAHLAGLGIFDVLLDVDVFRQPRCCLVLRLLCQSRRENE